MPTEDDKMKKHFADMDAYSNTSSVKKMWNYFIQVTRTDYFRDFVKASREKYKFPPKGVKPAGKSYPFLPKGFSTAGLHDEIVNKICKKYALHPEYYSDTIEHYIYYNHFLEPEYIGDGGLFRLSSVIDERELAADEPNGISPFKEVDDNAYPIILRISQYATQRDVLDFIKTKPIWDEIERMQKYYQDKNIKIGKVRTKNKVVQERNDFIYSNRHLKLKKIAALLHRKYKDNRHILDEGSIAKIISLETKLRKDVST
jgi:hypothetical protein